ncbi:hypothetical protein H2198_000858 [Neophaeococcomyces mojaviensis]|uniref:Uncharacterized protein n=1 Tax=Neophaeococcomyces mojaviensis TaxID=3383035 RepID=A0ACC3AJ76_9EURO|nr:hypothetical protein H2198_000858 [Knufia sp. JES_112]
MSQSQRPEGPPYAPRAASAGGVPSVLPDVPIAAVLISIYLGFAITNMTIFQLNRKRHYKFFPTVFIFGFCMARLATLVLRIAWATRQHNVRLAIAANIFVSAGILIIYVVNLLFAQRILRATQPKIGWNPVLSTVFKVFYGGIGAALIMVITASVLGMYTLNMSTLKAVRDVQLAASTYLLLFVTLPLLLLILSQFLPNSGSEEQFGQGSMTKKKLIVLAVSCLSITIAGFKTGSAWMPARPISNPAWYQSKACFYVFNFAFEILILIVLTATRPDRVFYVPNGSKRAGDYTRLNEKGSGDSVHSLQDKQRQEYASEKA